MKAVIEDPPYGMNESDFDVQEFLKSCLEGKAYDRKGRGIAGQEWDKQFPGVDYFKEVMRVLKPGGFYVGFCSGPNMGLFKICAMCAGLEVIDLGAWFYGKGMASGRKAVLGENPFSEKIENPIYGFAKAFEPILIARKPIEKGLTVAKNFEKYGTGLINGGEASYCIDGKRRSPTHAYWDGTSVVEELLGNDAKFARKCSSSLLDQVFAHPKPTHLEKNFGVDEGQGYSIQGNLVEGLRNELLTVKPIELMVALIQAFTKEGDTVLDGYLGSGTTGIAALLTGRNFIGIELSEQYFDLASDRLLNVKVLRERFPKAEYQQLILQFEYEHLNKELNNLSKVIASGEVAFEAIERFKSVRGSIRKIESGLAEYKKAS
ncbi:MAG: site-specific DNA-methyltransferase [Bdellovibrio sp.]